MKGLIQASLGNPLMGLTISIIGSLSLLMIPVDILPCSAVRRCRF